MPSWPTSHAANQRARVLHAIARATRGGLDILVTAHGHVRPRPAAEVDPDDWDLTFASNPIMVFQLSQLAFTVMEPHVGARSSISPRCTRSWEVLRVAPCTRPAKGGVGQLTRSLALEWAPLGINVNVIAPGYVRTKLNRHIWDDPERAAQVIERIPAGRWGEPEDLSGTVVFLASGLSDYIHGVVLPVDGGYLVCESDKVTRARLGVDSFSYHRWFGESNQWEQPR